ncbi:MAG: ATP-NAD kinase family protein [Zestosphaera sp.]
MKLGFVVNPIAGMGGSVGLKGTDGELYEEALKRGAKPVAPSKAVRFLQALSEKGFQGVIVAANSVMGCDYLSSSRLRFSCLDLPDRGKSVTSREDTLRVIEVFLKSDVDLIVFVGGDGTARDVLSVAGTKVPILGVPSGVKMYSGVFATSPEVAAEVVVEFERGNISVDQVEVADVDEIKLKEDLLNVRLYGYAVAPVLEGFVVPSKDLVSGSEEEKWGIAKYFIEEYMFPGVLYFLGPGTTTKAIADLLGLKKTLLGVDAIYERKLVGRDLSESEILRLIEKYGRVSLVVSVIGRQGYIFGRGNQQFSARVLRLVKKTDIFVLATHSKLAGIKYLLIDVGDPELELELSGYWRVITGYGEETVKLVLPACCVDKYLSSGGLTQYLKT